MKEGEWEIDMHSLANGEVSKRVALNESLDQLASRAQLALLTSFVRLIDSQLSWSRLLQIVVAIGF